MTKEEKQYFIDTLTAPFEENDTFNNIDPDLNYAIYHNCLIERPEYIAAVNDVVNLLDQYGNIGQVEDIINLMMNNVLKELIRLINV